MKNKVSVVLYSRFLMYIVVWPQQTGNDVNYDVNRIEKWPCTGWSLGGTGDKFFLRVLIYILQIVAKNGVYHTGSTKTCISETVWVSLLPSFHKYIFANQMWSLSKRRRASNKIPHDLFWLSAKQETNMISYTDEVFFFFYISKQQKHKTTQHYLKKKEQRSREIPYHRCHFIRKKKKGKKIQKVR